MMDIHSISEKLRIALFRRTFPVPVELLLFGCCTRGWILDHGTMVPSLSDLLDDGQERIADIGAIAAEWCKARSHDGRRIRWRDFSLEDLARGIGEPANDVRTWFQLIAEVDFRRWKTKQRIDIACELMKDGEESIASVARRAGFRDIANFSRQFRRITGCSPSQWKSNLSDD